MHFVYVCVCMSNILPNTKIFAKENQMGIISKTNIQFIETGILFKINKIHAFVSIPYETL